MLRIQEETGFMVKIKLFTKKKKTNQEAEWDIQLIRCLLCLQFVFQNSQENRKYWKQAKCRGWVAVVLKKKKPAQILMLQKSLHS